MRLLEVQRKSLHVDKMTGSTTDSTEFSSSLLQAAHSIYQAYYKTNPEQMQQPSGVAIDRLSLRGKLLFAIKPILLPKECFVPLSQIKGLEGKL